MSPFTPRRPDNGWWPAADYPDAPINDELYAGGVVVGAVMCFYDDAPVYAIASLPEGLTVRSGAMESDAAARDWTERMVGNKPRRPGDERYLRGAN